MSKRKRYYATLDRNGTEDEITIRTPDGREMAFMQFWEYFNGERTEGAKQAEADAELIVKALNAYKGRK